MLSDACGQAARRPCSPRATRRSPTTAWRATSARPSTLTPSTSWGSGATTWGVPADGVLPGQPGRRLRGGKRHHRHAAGLQVRHDRPAAARGVPHPPRRRGQGVWHPCVPREQHAGDDYYPRLARRLFHLAADLSHELCVHVAFVDLSGGIGIAYEPGQRENDIRAIGEGSGEPTRRSWSPPGWGTSPSAPSWAAGSPPPPARS